MTFTHAWEKKKKASGVAQLCTWADMNLRVCVHMHVSVYLSAHANVCVDWFAGEEEAGRERQWAVPGWRLCLPGEIPRGSKALQTHRPRIQSPEHVHGPAHVWVRQGDWIISWQKHTYAWTAYLCINMDRTNWKTACFKTLEHMFFFIVCSHAKLGPRTMFHQPPLPSVFHLLIYHWNLYIYHLISTHIFLHTARVTYTHRCSCKWSTNGEK